MDIETCRVVLVPFDPVPAALDRNADRIARTVAGLNDADVVIFPHLALTGRPSVDGRFVTGLVAAAEEVAAQLAVKLSSGPALILGSPWRDAKSLHDAALVLDKGTIIATRFRHSAPPATHWSALPAFDCASRQGPVTVRGVRMGILLACDIDSPDVAQFLFSNRAEMLVALNGAPFSPHAPDIQVQRAMVRVQETKLPLLSVNLLGAQGSMVYDGHAFALTSDRWLAASIRWSGQPLALRAERFGSAPDIWAIAGTASEAALDEAAALVRAVTLWIADQVRRQGRTGAVVLFGADNDGGDELIAAVAAAAVGPGRLSLIVDATNGLSVTRAAGVAAALGCNASVAFNCSSVISALPGGFDVPANRHIAWGAALAAFAAQNDAAVLSGQRYRPDGWPAGTLTPFARLTVQEIMSLAKSHFALWEGTEPGEDRSFSDCFRPWRGIF